MTFKDLYIGAFQTGDSFHYTAMMDREHGDGYVG